LQIFLNQSEKDLKSSAMATVVEEAHKEIEEEAEV
jgi:hypothetical protein